jgi:hypothetical protein
VPVTRWPLPNGDVLRSAGAHDTSHSSPLKPGPARLHNPVRPTGGAFAEPRLATSQAWARRRISCQMATPTATRGDKEGFCSQLSSHLAELRGQIPEQLPGDTGHSRFHWLSTCAEPLRVRAGAIAAALVSKTSAAAFLNDFARFGAEIGSGHPRGELRYTCGHSGALLEATCPQPLRESTPGMETFRARGMTHRNHRPARLGAGLPFRRQRWDVRTRRRLRWTAGGRCA